MTIAMLVFLGIVMAAAAVAAVSLGFFSTREEIYEDVRTGRDRGGALAGKIMLVAAGMVALLLWMGGE